MSPATKAHIHASLQMIQSCLQSIQVAMTVADQLTEPNHAKTMQDTNRNQANPSESEFLSEQEEEALGDYLGNLMKQPAPNGHGGNISE